MALLPEKITTVATNTTYSLSYFLISFGLWLKKLDWNQIAIVCGIFLAFATFFINWHYRREQTKAIKLAAQRGVLIVPPED